MMTVTRIDGEYVVMRPEWDSYPGPMTGSFGMAVDCLLDNTLLTSDRARDYVLRAGDGEFVTIPSHLVTDMED